MYGPFSRENCGRCKSLAAVAGRPSVWRQVLNKELVAEDMLVRLPWALKMNAH